MKIKTEQNVYQFKNAVHMGYMNCQEPTNNTESCINTQRSGLKFSPETSRSTMQHSKNIVGSRKTIQHVGITIDDEGNVLIAKWKNNKINGKYFLFKPLGFNEQSRTRQSGICQFGFMNNSMLYNQNYLYDINGSFAKSSFERDKIYDKCYIYHKSNLKGSKQKIQCKLLTFQSNIKSNISPKQKNKIYIPPIKNLGKNVSSKQNLPLVDLSPSQISTLSKFIQHFIEQVKQQQVIQYMPFQKIVLNQTEFCLGFFRNETAQNKKGRDKQSTINNISGFGILFRNDWPYKYGFFQQGKLNGSGRLYQSQLQVLDGLFQDDQLIQGSIFDYFKSRTYFGQKIENQFKVHQEIDSIDTTYMLEYKKSQHLKSLDFINNYFNLPNIIYKSPWPYQVAKILDENNSLKYIINEFKNDVDISQIERKGQLTEDKVQELLIRELKQPEQSSRVITSRSKVSQVKSMAIKNGINSYLKRLQPSPQLRQNSRQRELKRSIQQYEQLKIARKSTSGVKKRSEIKSRQQSKAKKSSKLSKNNKPQLTSKEIHIQDHSNCSQQKSKDFGELISTYREYQVQKNAILTQEAFFQNLNKLKKHKVQSKSTMIKLDHQKHLNDMNRNPRKPCHHKKNRTALQLDLIYRMHFKQLKK